ncbi:MAG: TraB/GumN family protein [Methanolinea sp.]|jgi:pheromone shutdown-related protein TraB|nr:TraB/GumN family protein [Methanolinea sp.]
MTGELRIVGTAHVSAKSVEEVRAAIEEFRPDVVAVELDPARYAVIKKQAKDPSVKDVLEAKNFTQILVQWILAYLQRRIGLDLGVEPGAEMKAAIEEAETRGLAIGLIDRDIGITLRRFWRSLSFLEKLKMFYALAVSVVSIDGEEIDVEELKKQDMITMAMEEFRNFSPNGARALIDERDAYLAHNLVHLASKHSRVLAVLGAGHVQGVQKYLDAPATIPPVQELTAEVKSRPWGLIFGVAVTALFIFLLLAIAFSGVGLEVLMMALIYWVLIHGVLTAVFTLAARGHPLSALTGFAVSWFTALNPLIAAGWFSAIVEAKIRKPAPADFRLIFEAESLSEMMKVPLFRVVLVAALANLGSTLGTILYFVFIFPVLGIDPGVLITQGLTNMWSAISGVFS